MVLNIINSEADLTKNPTVVYTAFSIFIPDLFSDFYSRVPDPEEVAISQIFPLIRAQM